MTIPTQSKAIPVRIENISRTYVSARGTVNALDGVSLEIRAGEFFVLLGPSGSGKSTLLAMLAGLDAPTAGTIRFGDRVVAGPSMFLGPAERNVAMVFQSYALYPHLCVFENIAFPLRVAREPKDVIETEVKRAAESVRIADLLKSRPAELSGGQRQRVAIARAIVRKPVVFLMDEPLSNLDARLRTETRGELKTIQRALGITTIYVTHDQTEATTLGDRIAVLNHGQLEQCGTSDDLYETPESPFVASFIGSPPANVFNAECVGDGETRRLLIAGTEFEASGAARLPSGPITVALRPENLRLESAAEGTIPVEVEAVERIGRETLAWVRAESGLRLAVWTEHGAFAASDRAGLRVDASALRCWKRNS